MTDGFPTRPSELKQGERLFTSTGYWKNMPIDETDTCCDTHSKRDMKEYVIYEGRKNSFPKIIHRISVWRYYRNDGKFEALMTELVDKDSTKNDIDWIDPKKIFDTMDSLMEAIAEATSNWELSKIKF